MSAVTNLIAREPIRVYLYSVFAAAIAVALVFGWVTADKVPVILALVAAVLAVPTIEKARSKVSPVED